LKGKQRKEVRKQIKEEITVLSDNTVEKIAKEVGIQLPAQLITGNLNQAVEFASKHFPVVIKATSKDLTHKTDFKGVFLDIRTITEFQEKFDLLVSNIEKTTKKNAPEVLIQEMIEPKVEFFIGANREGGTDIYQKNGLGFGHLMAIGQGGIYTEVYKDIQHILVPETVKNIVKKLNSTDVVKIIDGYRGKPALAKDKLIDTIDKVQKMLVTYPEIYSIDMNPIIITENKVVAVDLKIYIKD
ncbi:MAG TPA: acetate--CoA ligase family protein, partial [Candidatus Dojkabacteria bacterium]|nr:acetate--CoA ligase family protein [Candidatus Dojkabacteria bacterium]